MGDVFVKYTLLLLSVICLAEAKPLGLQRLRTRKGYFDFESSVQVTPHTTRRLKQAEDATECELSEDAVEGLLDGDTRVWSLDDAALSDFGLQAIVDCTQEGDIVLFDLGDVFKPTERIVIPWNLTLSSTVQEPDLRDGIFPSSASKLRMTCPDENVGMFLVEAVDVLFANLVFEDCVLSEENKDVAIVEVGSCESEEDSGTIRFHHVDFSNNNLTAAPGLNVSSEGCSSVEMIDVGFEENECRNFCGAFLSARENTLTNIRLKNNAASNQTSEISAVVYCPPKSTTQAADIVASGNEVTSVHIANAILDIIDSSFTENRLRSGNTFASVLYLRNSSVKIRNCEFEDNFGEKRGLAVSVVNCGSVEISDCRFEGNNASILEGPSVYSNNTEFLRISKTSFTENFGDLGGAVYLRNTKSEFDDCSFKGNSATRNAGGVFLENGQSIVTNCIFDDNVADGLGGGLDCFGGSMNISDSRFYRNKARGGAGTLVVQSCIANFRNITWEDNEGSDNYGGALKVVESTGLVQNSIVKGNSAKWGGGIFFDNGNGTCSNVTFTNNKGIEFGGGLATRRSNVNITDCHFEFNECLDGAAAYFGVQSNATVSNCSASSNAATRYAGGIAATGSSRVNVAESSFQNNSALGRYGGCMYISQGFLTLDAVDIVNSTSGEFGGALMALESITAINSSVFEDNRAESDGGAIAIQSAFSVMTNCNITNNHAEAYGGGILVTNSTALLYGLTVTNNRAWRGGGVFYNKSNGLCSNVTFTDNIGGTFGGGLGTQNTTIEVADCNFQENRCENGAAIYFGKESNATVSNCSVFLNTATESAGAMVVLSGSRVSVLESVFHSNIATQGSGGAFYVSAANLSMTSVKVSSSSCLGFGGGLVAYSSPNISLSNTTVQYNSAKRDGGGLAIFSSSLNLTNSSIIESKATGDGGGILLIRGSAELKDTEITDCFTENRGGGIYSEDSSFTADNVTLLRNEAGFSGGCFSASEEGSFVFTNSVFNHCSSTYGAGVDQYRISGTLISCSGYNNSANLGGMAYLQEANLTIKGGRFLQSKAILGAGITLSSGWLMVSESVFSGGNASKGGAIYTGRSYIIAEDVQLEDNQAEYGGSLYLRETYTWAKNLQVSGCRATEDGGGLYADDRSSFLCFSCTFRDNSANGNGGGAQLKSDAPQLLAYQFDVTAFEYNRAKLGGGINFVSEVGAKNCSDPKENCTFVALRGASFRGNEASTAGGGIMSTDLNSIRFSCSYSSPEDSFAYLTREEYYKLRSIDSLDTLCDEWRPNTAKIYGNEVASVAVGIKSYVWLDDDAKPTPMESNIYSISDQRSGSPLPDLYFESVDQFGQGPAISDSSGEVTATMTSPDRLFEGSTQIQFIEGGCNFTGTTIYKEAGLYQVVVDFNDSSIPQFSMVVRVRDCMIGETPVANRVLCQPCSGDTYNFYPQREDPGCVPCPDHGDCSTHVILPGPGYWHFTPCSTRIQECLSERACKDGARYDDLKDLGDGVSSCNFSSDFIAEYADAQCAKGYRGPLCGSCEASYGRSRAFRCEKCFSGFWNFLLVVVALFTLLVLSSYAIGNSLPVHRKRNEILNPENANAPVQALPPESQDYCGTHLAELAIRGNSMIRSRRIEEENNGEQGGVTAAVLELEMAKWKTVEILKITINYLQVIAIAVSINVNWNDGLTFVFKAAEFIGGVTSEAATKSMDCLVSDDNSISRPVFRTVVNILVPLAVAGFWSVFWGIAMFLFEEPIKYLTKRSILSICVVSYLSYIAVTKTAVNALYCVGVYDSPNFESDITTAYWAADTQLKCYEGSHAILATAIGWPVAIFFSLGFPVTVATKLVSLLDDPGMNCEWIYESIGFLYRAYSSKYIFWESVVMLRKAILVLLVVVAYPLGGNLQIVLCAFVLTVALYVQTVCSPFREEFDELNRLEGFSLLVSSLTFASGQFYSDSHTSSLVRLLLTLFLFVANFGLLGFFGFAFYRSSGCYIRKVLDVEGIDYDSSGGTKGAIGTYLEVRFAECFERLFRFNSPPTATP